MSESVYSNEYQSFLALLRSTRLQAGLSQREVARRMGRSQSFVAKAEQGHNRVDIAQLVAFCHALEVPLLEFIRSYDGILSAEMSKPSASRSQEKTKGKRDAKP